MRLGYHWLVSSTTGRWVHDPMSCVWGFVRAWCCCSRLSFLARVGLVCLEFQLIPSRTAYFKALVANLPEDSADQFDFQLYSLPMYTPVGLLVYLVDRSTVQTLRLSLLIEFLLLFPPFLVL